MSFSKIAKIYDRFNDLESYERWLDFTLNSVADKPERVLDVACGTGWFATLLAPFVEHITAIDIDEKMLDIARSEDVASVVHYQKANMLDLTLLNQNYQLVTCFADSLCFLDNQQQVETAIRQMVDRLESGGTLLFDVWTPYQLSEGFANFSYFDSDDSAAIMWDSDVDEKRLQVEHYLTVFMRDNSSEQYERIDITLVERTYPLLIYRDILSQLPISQVEIFVDFGAAYYDAKKHQKADRWFFRVVKQ